MPSKSSTRTRRRGRDLAGEHLSGLPGRLLQPHLFLQLRAATTSGRSTFRPSRCLLDYFRGVAGPLRPQEASSSSRPRSRRWPGTRRRRWSGRSALKDAAGSRAGRGQCGDHRGGPAQPAPRYPDIKGREQLRRARRSTPPRWRHDIDLTGKRVAVIGTGASAYQFVPRDRPGEGRRHDRLPAHAALGLSGRRTITRMMPRPDELAAGARARSTTNGTGSGCSGW